MHGATTVMYLEQLARRAKLAADESEAFDESHGSSDGQHVYTVLTLDGSGGLYTHPRMSGLRTSAYTMKYNTTARKANS